MADPVAMANAQVEPSEIEREAARWFSRLHSDTLIDADQVRFGQWMAADERHLGAFEEMERRWHRSSLLAVGLDVQDASAGKTGGTFSAKFIARVSPKAAVRTAWLGPVLASIVIMAIFLKPASVYSSGDLPVQIALPDQSRISLAPRSRVRVIYRGDQRVVDLLQGSASFNVTEDPKRAFILWAGNGRLDATSTKFSVALTDRGTELDVKGGLVRLSVAHPLMAGTAVAERIVHAGESLTYLSSGLGSLANSRKFSALGFMQTRLSPTGLP